MTRGTGEGDRLLKASVFAVEGKWNENLHNFILTQNTIKRAAAAAAGNRSWKLSMMQPAEVLVKIAGVVLNATVVYKLV